MPEEELTGGAVCPGCKSETLQELEDRGVPFMGCTSCFGLFVGEEDLKAYVVDSTGEEGVGRGFLDLLRNALAGSVSQSVRLCYACGKHLYRFGFGESPFMILDRCPEHGIWMDKKELKKVVRAARAHAAAKSWAPAFSEPDEEEDAY